MINFASASIPIRLRKSIFLHKDPFDGQYMETRSFDIEGRGGVKVPQRGGSHLWTVWQLPTEDNFQDKKFWLQIARQNISWNVVKNGNGALLWEAEGGGGSAHPPQRQKGPTVSRKMWQARKCYILVFPVGLVGGRRFSGAGCGGTALSPRSGVPISEACSRARPRLVGFGGGLRQLGLGLTPSNINILNFCDNQGLLVYPLYWVQKLDLKVTKNRETQH